MSIITFLFYFFFSSEFVTMMEIKTHERPASVGSNAGTDDSRSDSERSPPPVPKLKMGALDIANMIAKHKPSPTSPSTGSVSPTQVSPLSTSVKPLDLSQYSRLPVPSAFKGGFYPYQGAVSIPPGLSVYPYNADAAASLSAAAAAANPNLNGTAALPMYSYPITETSGSPSVSTLRLSALLASRKRRSGGSTSGESNDSDEKNLDASSRKKVRPVPEEKKDAAYWERRRKNNDAAKRSRDARRAKEEEIALRAVFLEQDNMKLRAEVSILKSELARLHYMVYNC